MADTDIVFFKAETTDRYLIFEKFLSAKLISYNLLDDNLMTDESLIK